jgi:hypothetical protein
VVEMDQVYGSPHHQPIVFTFYLRAPPDLQFNHKSIKKPS